MSTKFRNPETRRRTEGGVWPEEAHVARGMWVEVSCGDSLEIPPVKQQVLVLSSLPLLSNLLPEMEIQHESWASDCIWSL